MFKKIAIVGVGLIGGSIGIAVREKKLAKEVIGIGRRRSSIQKAIRKKAIDRGTLDVKRGVSDADLIIIAVSVDKVIAKIKEAIRYAKRDAIIIDVHSTKKIVVDYAEKIINKDRYFVGTHPIAGLEKLGVLNATGELFKDTVCVVTPTKHTNKEALKRIVKFWKILGARVRLLNPQAHDTTVAKISHLPHLLAYNLCNTVSPSDLNVAGSGFKDTTRIAKSEPKMWLNIFLQNSDNILGAVKSFEENLSLLKSCIRRKSRPELLKRLYDAQRKRESIE